MNNNQVSELIELKFKVMIQKIDNLYLICNMIFKNSENRENNFLEVVKEKYIQMYNKIMQTKQYEQYKGIEDIVIKEIAKVELSIDQYIYNTNQRCEEIIKINLEKIYQSSNYQNFNNLEQEIQNIRILNEILKLYRPYISKNKEEKLQEEITKVKFDLLYRKQVEQFIYENKVDCSIFLQYDNKNEKIFFERLLQERINLIKSKFTNSCKDCTNQVEEDELFKIPIEEVMSNNRTIERLIIIDMKVNPYNYINLLKAKIFNAHLCNIGNNPFEKKVYITEEQIKKLGLDVLEMKYSNFNSERFVGYDRVNKRKGLQTNSVNYSLLKAILKNIITEKNISIIDCEKKYKKFGFECKPILVNTGQECIKMIFDEVKKSKEFVNNLDEFYNKKEIKLEQQYCKLDFEGLLYEFDNEGADEENLFNEIISKRNIELMSSMQKKKFFSRRQEKTKNEDILQEKKEKVKIEGKITKDIDIIILLINDIIEQNNNELKKINKILEQESDQKPDYSSHYYYKKIPYEENIRSEKVNIQWLEKLKNKNEKLTLEEERILLLIIGHVYKQLYIKCNIRNILPLEDMKCQEYLAPIPKRIIFDRNHRIDTEGISEPLWEKYKSEFKGLDIEVKLYRYDGSKPHFEICLNLNDISDLPIDYEKVKLLTKEELQNVIDIEEGNEK